jgi:hypothetical protein
MANLVAKPLQPIAQQVILAAEVGVESRTADIGARKDVIDGQIVIIARSQQVDECAAKRAPGSLYPTIVLADRPLSLRDEIRAKSRCDQSY